jgi:hypothetical protein
VYDAVGFCAGAAVALSLALGVLFAFPALWPAEVLVVCAVPVVVVSRRQVRARVARAMADGVGRGLLWGVATGLGAWLLMSAVAVYAARQLAGVD